MAFAHYCPICGAGTNDRIEALPEAPPGTAVRQHRCRPATLRGIDAMLSSESAVREDRRTLGGRLRTGFAMMGDYYEGD